MPEKQPPVPPQISPYVFPVILAGLGLWCFYDGWLSSAPEMQEYLLFNRIGSVVLLSWSLADYVRTRRFEKAEEAESQADQTGS